MAFYLVSAVPKPGLMEELGDRLGRGEFVGMRPFGKALTKGLKMRASAATGSRSGRRRIIAARRSRKSGRRCSTTTSRTSGWRRWSRARAGIRSNSCPGSSQSSWRDLSPAGATKPFGLCALPEYISDP